MDENGNRFEVISSKTSNANFKQSNGFGKTVLVPFISGIMGCALVIGTCFGVPSIKEKLTGSTTISNTTVQTSSGTTSNLISFKSLFVKSVLVFVAKTPTGSKITGLLNLLAAFPALTNKSNLFEFIVPILITTELAILTTSSTSSFE